MIRVRNCYTGIIPRGKLYASIALNYCIFYVIKHLTLIYNGLCQRNTFGSNHSSSYLETY